MTIKNTCKLVAVITAIAMIFTVFAAFSGVGSIETYAASETKINKTGTVTNGPVNVRTGPGTKYKVLGKVSKGKSIKVLTKAKDSKGNSWYKYKYSSSKYGYVSASYVKLKSSSDKTSTFTRKGTVKSSTLKMRSGPGTSYKQLGTLKKGTAIYIKKKVTKSSGTVWYQFTYNGKTSYVNGKFIKLTDVVSETSINNSAVVNDGPLNVRSGPGTGYKSLGKVSEGKKITVLAKIKNSKSEYWYKYKYSSSKYGYLSSKYVDLQDKTENFERKATVKSATLKVRSKADSSGTHLGTLKKGAVVYIKQKVIKPSGTVWYQFTYNTKTAYVNGKFLTLTNIVKETVMDSEAVITDGPLNVRSGPGSTYSAASKLAAGDSVTVKSEVKNTSNETWYYIKYGSKYGYVSADYVKLGSENQVSYQMGTVTTDAGITLNVRSGPGSEYDRIGALSSGTTIIVTGSKKAANGKLWYEFDFNGSKNGWVCSDYMTVKTVKSSSAFEVYMDAQGFPESYKPALRALNAAHPKWVFKAYDVGCSWSSAVNAENKKPGINVVSSSSPKSYRSKDSDCYNSKTGVWSKYDGGWYSAHTDVIRYYMDPRNFLNETGIYQFLTHKYDSETQNATTVAAVAKGTFMETREPGNGWSSFATLINAAGKESGVNPNVLAAMIVQEQGVKGTSGSISGKVKGYEGYYNFLNVGAWTTSTMTAVQRGLWYAEQEGWNTEYKSILGGAKIYYNNYVERNQYTFYTKKFNVMNGASQIGVHQYMTNVEGAYGEGLQLKKAFPDKYNEALTFIIPVYDSMPASACKLP